jgi:hypothetical protein
MREYITQNALNNAVLFKLFEHAQIGDSSISPIELAKKFSIAIGPVRVGLAFSDLSQKDFVNIEINMRSIILAKGYNHVEVSLCEEGSFFSNYAEFGDEWLAKQTLSQNGIPASDRIVSRSDNQVALNEVNGWLDNIIEILKTDNVIGDVLGVDRDLILSEANASKEMLKSSRFRLARLVQLLLPALKFLSEKFSGAAIGEAAKHLISLIVALF